MPANVNDTTITGKYPCLISFLGFSPVTYAKRFNAYRGAYMGFVADKDTKTVTTPGVVKQLKNVFLAGQWLMGSGGLPPATAQGKYAAWRICKKEGVECK